MNISRNRTALYVIAIVVIIVAFLLLGGAQWINGLVHESRSISTAHLKWGQILISLGLGFLLGWVVFGRKW
jgi:hypothetical protein